MDKNMKSLFTLGNKWKITPPVSQDKVNQFSDTNKLTLAKINPLVMAAIEHICKIGFGTSGAYGVRVDDTGNIYRTVELRTDKGTYVAALYADIEHKNDFAAFAKAKDDKLCPYLLEDDNGLLAMTLILFDRVHFDTDTGIKEKITRSIEIFKEGISEKNDVEMSNLLAVISEDAFRLLANKPPFNMFDKDGKPNRIFYSSVENGKIVPNKVLYGSFTIFDTVKNDIDEVVKKKEESFLLYENSEREFTDEEKMLIPTIPSWYIMPDFVKDVCKQIKRTSNAYLPKRNFMFRGPSSTGKTSAAKAVAALLGLPYVYITCSSDTESYAFIGEPMYDENGNVRYITSDFVRAMKYGWVVEIQEPYVIAKQGVLTALNGILETDGMFRLPSGELVKRHKDAIVFFTTNVSYVGCKKPNQSVLRRFNNVYEVEMPSKAEVIARVSSLTGFKDNTVLSKMHKCIMDINVYLKDKCIDDGVCGVSEFVDWVQTYQCLDYDDIIEAAKTTVVAKATDDSDAQTDIISLLEAVFPQKGGKTVFQ